MYESYPTFIQPENENVKIWRYMDFTKFIFLIDTKSLFFTRADKFEDPFEGSFPKVNVDARSIVPPEIPEESREGYKALMNIIANPNKHWPKNIAVNCWHENEYESAAMWKLYLKSNEGIAIQSTYKKLKGCIVDDETVYIGRVKYIDYETELINSSYVLEPFVHKRKSFEHEKEIRALIQKYPIGEKGIDFDVETMKVGASIKIDIETLIQRVYIAPNAPNWFAELVERVCLKYGYTFEIIHSELEKNPLF